MREWQSLSHVKWECKYHVVIVPKYRKKVLYGRLRGEVGKIIRQLCRQKEVELIEGHAMPDHIHLVLSVPPKYSIAMVLIGLDEEMIRAYVRDQEHLDKQEELDFTKNP